VGDATFGHLVRHSDSLRGLLDEHDVAVGNG
jgi:hypothetical protein